MNYERKIQENAAKIRGLTFGYIGNIEPWGDCRRLFLWVNTARQSDGKLPSIWSCEAKELNSEECLSAMRAIHSFTLGYSFGVSDLSKHIKASL